MSATAMAAPLYPRELERTVALRDGTRVRIRPIRPDDADRLVALYSRLSLDTRYHRFFSAMRRLPPDWARFLATVDYRRRLALVAEADALDDPDVIGVARYESEKNGDAVEVAFCTWGADGRSYRCRKPVTPGDAGTSKRGTWGITRQQSRNWSRDEARRSMRRASGTVADHSVVPVSPFPSLAHGMRWRLQW